MNAKCSFLLVVIVLVLPFGGTPQVPPATAPGASLIDLIANPGKFDGKAVTVDAFLNLSSPDGNMLFLHREDFEHGLIENAIEIEPSNQMTNERERLDMNYVVVVGTFRGPEKTRHYGRLTEIKRCNLRVIPPTLKHKLKHDSNP